MTSPHSMFHPSELQLSKFRFYSVGIVANNKALSSDIIEVTPTEELTMLDGEIDGNNVNVGSKGVNATGEAYETNVATSMAIQAKWLKLSCSNRLTAPDVRRGAPVIIYQFGDSDKYYWTTLLDDSKLRKLETVVWGISSTTVEGATPAPDNMYYFEVSSHQKLVTFHTSQANGEQWGYDVQINADKGYVVIEDTAGNYFKLDSSTSSLTMKNVDGSIIDITKEICTITTPSEINLQTKNYTLKADNVTTSATSTKLTTTNYDLHADQSQMTGSSVAISAGNTVISGETLLVTSTSVDFQ